ncbi:polysaccharide deacetylase family protein [Mesorhizobium xinjiangense]|uniref:polysaccharide deacetylase n=1 Tax=Mesorhizobium xinjiangense TaxID=2678685 RepID=UPI0012ED50D1|nr:polysaccharide deacetylase [Mesorhizobium xinjiangense]
MPICLRGLLLPLCLFALAGHANAQTEAQRPQYVVISFDGAHDIAQWRRSRALAQETGAHFTYFLSCVFLLTRDNRDLYHPPRKSAGRSNVGFASSREEIAARLEQILGAHGEGHEIASHGCGHFDGKDWSAKDWEQEFDQFSAIVAGAYANNGIEAEPEGWQSLAAGMSKGFRAPYLSTSPQLYEALAARGFAYDASTVSRGPDTPRRKAGVWHFALPLIAEGPARRRIIAMDYNLFVRHSGGVERSDSDGAFEERAYRAFRAAFEKQYSGKRRPLQVGFHFTLMNGGAYWRALERFATDVCTKADVECVSYSGLVEALEAEPAAHVGG